jgi:flagellar hook-length control protein FliK
MQTDRLGTVELRARVTGDEVGAAITVEKRDAHAALAAELPALQQALSEKHLRVDQLSLLQGSLHSNPGDPDAQQRPQDRTRGVQPVNNSAAEQRIAPPAISSDANSYFDSNGRLSVRA